MLVLTIKNGQDVKIGDATLTVLESHKGRIRVGIKAPDDVRITRVPLTAAGLNHHAENSEEQDHGKVRDAEVRD